MKGSEDFKIELCNLDAVERAMRRALVASGQSVPASPVCPAFLGDLDGDLTPEQMVEASDYQLLIRGNLAAMGTTARFARVELPEWVAARAFADTAAPKLPEVKSSLPTSGGDLPVSPAATARAVAASGRSATDVHIDRLAQECREKAALLKARTGEVIHLPQITAPVPYGTALLSYARCRDRLNTALHGTAPSDLYTPPGQAMKPASSSTSTPASAPTGNPLQTEGHGFPSAVKKEPPKLTKIPGPVQLFSPAVR